MILNVKRRKAMYSKESSEKHKMSNGVEGKTNKQKQKKRTVSTGQAQVRHRSHLRIIPVAVVMINIKGF